MGCFVSMKLPENAHKQAFKKKETLTREVMEKTITVMAGVTSRAQEDADDLQNEVSVESSEVDVKARAPDILVCRNQTSFHNLVLLFLFHRLLQPVYVKDDFFDSLSSDSLPDPSRCLIGVGREVQVRSPVLNFNVHFRICGVAANNRSACGGVLFGKNGEIRALFSGPACGKNRFSAGLFAVKMAVEIFISSGWALEVPLVICMNCKIIHSWLENPMQYSWELAKEIVEIMCLLRNLSDYRLQLIDRDDNVWLLVWLGKD
ncbi:hypothetical protein V6N11_001154 [Hibiscus sabdariffa]|uniref:FFD box profile domain-containing protein n=1 Tax=Hibiscus sabdariffa TaxID=183260 RepID=A0ABR2RYX4_9ROSI